MIAGTAAVMLISRSHGQRTWEPPHRIPVAFLQAPGLAKVRRARFGPGLWPGPRRQARGYGSVIHPVSGRWPVSCGGS